MFAKIRFRSGTTAAISYNERKVDKGMAQCIHAENFLYDAPDMNIRQKLDRFKQRTSLNTKAEKNALHISLSFHADDILSDEIMLLAAKKYMSKMGFDEQPYLVYRHHDTQQPHLHLVTTNIKEDGKRIEARELIFWESRSIARDVTSELGLTPFRPASIMDKEIFEVKHARRIEYGKVHTHRAVSDVLNAVVPNYSYTSFDELNAVLRLYNVEANMGKPSSRLYQSKGLLFHVLDADGHRVGAPLKASAFFLKPTRSNIEKRFTVNMELRQTCHNRIITRIEMALFKQTPSWPKLLDRLRTDRVGVVEIAEKGVVWIKPCFPVKALAVNTLYRLCESGALRRLRLHRSEVYNRHSGSSKYRVWGGNDEMKENGSPE